MKLITGCGSFRSRFIMSVNYSVTELPEHLKKGGIPPFFRVHPWHHYCLLFRAIQLLLLFPVSSVRLRTVLFLLRIRSDIFSGYYMRLRHLRYRFCFHLCTTLSLSVWTALHIFSPLSVTADCTGWYNFLPTTIYLWLISLTSSKELSILLLKLLECR